jgi:hypothetical protein
MRGEDGTGLCQCIAAIAGPAIVGWVVHHGGAHGIEFDVALAGKQVGFGLDEGGLIAAIP